LTSADSRSSAGSLVAGTRSRQRYFLGALALLLIASLRISAANASGGDDWLGADKAWHFGISAALSSGVYAASASQYDARYPALLWGAGVSLTLGVGKELADATGLGTPSWKDLSWDAMGTAVGLLVAWSIDLVLRGVSPKHPAFATPARPPTQ
jgi:putative lipoprotein